MPRSAGRASPPSTAARAPLSDRRERMSNHATWGRLFQRLRWDLLDAEERQYYAFWLISGIPGLFGNMLRARFLGPRMKSAGEGLTVLAGCRFRSIEGLSVGRNVSIGY